MLAGATGAATMAAEESGGKQPSRSTKPQAIRLGGPMFVKTKDPDELAAAHRKIGYRAAYCPGIKLEDTDRIKATEKAFAKHDVVIAEVGRWCNLMDADPAQRKANLANVIDGLALADAVGARCCVDIAGSFSTEEWFGPHPDNISDRHFDAAVENARKIVDAVKPTRAKFCYEMMGWAYPDSPDVYLKMLKAVDRKGFGVHLDVCNLINSPRRFYNNTDLINECFDKLGPHIVSCHAKDLVWPVEMNVHFKEVPAGSGKLDYATHLRRLATLGHDAPLMLEHCANEDEYTQAREYLLDYGSIVGVIFG
jgi:sugar phosphate isomerase/epimerase